MLLRGLFMKTSYRLGLLIPEVIAPSRFRDDKKRLANPDVLIPNYMSPINLLVIELRYWIGEAIASNIEVVY